jgi:hypothetical protein
LEANIAHVTLHHFPFVQVPSFDTALKAGITADLVIVTVVHQIPPQFGCICNYGTVKCSSVYRTGLYMTENECFWDWWFRFTVIWSVIILSINVSTTACINPV